MTVAEEYMAADALSRKLIAAWRAGEEVDREEMDAAVDRREELLQQLWAEGHVPVYTGTDFQLTVEEYTFKVVIEGS